MKHLTVFTALVLCFFAPYQQQNSQDPDLSSDKVTSLAVSYDKKRKIGQILFGNTESKIEQYIDIWGKSSGDTSPKVITYVLDKRDARGRRFYTATWGKGPVERNAFQSSCLTTVPDFTDDVYWAAKVIEGKVEFEQIDESALKESVVKVLFRSVKGTTMRWLFDSARPITSNAPHDEQRVLIDLVNRKENRNTWYSKGWLRLENRCVRYFQ
jgi:hypothetical protein